jgi:hypothetical protein
MDFNDFLTEYHEKYGLSEEDWSDLRKYVVLSFTEDDSGRVSAKYKGVPVFSQREYEKIMSAGETWICSLDMSKETYYFAKGLQRIDSSFMYELKKDQIKEIADVIWNDQKHIIEPLLEDKYKEIMEAHMMQSMEGIKEKYEGQIRLMNEEIHQLQTRDAENKQIIASLQEQKEAMKKNEEHIISVGSVNEFIDIKDTHVRREGPDTISSPFFDRSRYFVHLSADHRLLAIKPHDSGNVICINNTMVLAGLSMISPFERSYDMVSEYSPQYGGLKIYL